MTRLGSARGWASVAGALAALYLAAAYALAPALWRHHERQAKLADLDLVTRTSLGIPGDPINVGVEGDKADLVCALKAAGWVAADPVRFMTSFRIVGSVVLRRPYLRAPVSPLFFLGRKQDLAFQKAAGRSASTRHHVRFWKALARGDDGLPVWLGAATFDRSVGFNHYTGQITHHIGPDVDAERDLLSNELAAAGKVDETYWASGGGAALFARNGGGDPYFTDGEIEISKLTPDCVTTLVTPRETPPPPAFAARSAAFSWLAKLRRTTQ